MLLQCVCIIHIYIYIYIVFFFVLLACIIPLLSKRIFVLLFIIYFLYIVFYNYYYHLMSFSCFPGLAVLCDEMKELAAQYYVPSSVNTCSMQIRTYFHFVDEFAGLLFPIPCPPHQVALYITWLAKFLKYSSVTNYLSALNFFLKSEGSPPIDYSDHFVCTVLGGVKRKLGCGQKMAMPLLHINLSAVFSHMTLSSGHIAVRAATLTALRGLLRKCQITLSDTVLLRSHFSSFPWFA